MVISGNSAVQSLSVTVNNVALAFTLSGTYTDFGSYLDINSNGSEEHVSLVVRSGPNLATSALTLGSATAPGYSEIDQWVLVSTSTSAHAKLATQRRIEQGLIGQAIGAALHQSIPAR